MLSTAVFRAFAKSPERQRFFFRVGGISTLNAFRSDTCKNEVFVYAQATMDYARLLNIPLRAYAGVRYSPGDVLSAMPHDWATRSWTTTTRSDRRASGSLWTLVGETRMSD